MTTNRHKTVLVSIGLVLASTGATTVQSAERAAAAVPCPNLDAVPTESEIPAGTSATQCDLVGEVIYNNDQTVGLVLPSIGDGVAATVESPGGDSFAIATTDSGALVYPVPETDVGATDGSRSDCALNMDAYAYNGHPWYSAPYWYINRATIPNNVLETPTVDAIRASFLTIQHSTNPCGMADTVNLSANYGGFTQNTANIYLDQYDHTICGARDGMNTVSFGRRALNQFGFTCQWSAQSDGHAIEADIELDSQHDWANAGLTAPNCQYQYDVQSVATHEAGHFFGLAHPRPSLAQNPSGYYFNAPLTMHAEVPACTVFKRDLARGDVLGLRGLY